MKTKDKIRELCRQKYGLSLTDYEQRLGFGNGSLSKNGFLRSDRLFKVANDLGVDMETLMDDEILVNTVEPSDERSARSIHGSVIPMDGSVTAHDYVVNTPEGSPLSTFEIEMVDAYRAADRDIQSIVEIALKLRRPMD